MTRFKSCILIINRHKSMNKISKTSKQSLYKVWDTKQNLSSEGRFRTFKLHVLFRLYFIVLHPLQVVYYDCLHNSNMITPPPKKTRTQKEDKLANVIVLGKPHSFHVVKNYIVPWNKDSKQNRMPCWCNAIYHIQIQPVLCRRDFLDQNSSIIPCSENVS